MITKFNSFLNESKHTGEYKKTLDVINHLVDDGDMILKNKTPEEITDIIIGKTKKYPQFGFESFFINMAEGNGFISEGDKERMSEYIEKIKEMGIDTSKLEQLYKSYKKYNDLWKEEEELSSDLRYYDEEEDEYQEIENKLKDIEIEIQEQEDVTDEFKEELKNISKKVVEKL